MSRIQLRLCLPRSNGTSTRTIWITVLAVALGGVLSGCSEVQPWKKGNLAKPIMAFDPDPGESAFRRHVYQSREGSFGGYGVAIGACGCN